MPFNPRSPSIAEAADLNVPALDQRDRLRAAAILCMEEAQKITPVDRSAEAFALCDVLSKAANWMGQHADAVDRAIAAGGVPAEPFPPGQKASDRVYARAWAKAFSQSADDLQKTLTKTIDTIHSDGMTPTLRAQLDAQVDVENHRGFNPPIYQPDAKWGPRPPKPEKPETE
jgi:hypothetical protein